MKKNIGIIFILILTIVFGNVQKVSAKTCSGNLYAPQIGQVIPTNKGQTVALTTTAIACKGSNTEVWYSNFGSLPTSYTPSSGTVVYGSLYEEDPPGNPDELVKTYTGRFSGRVLTDFTLQLINTPGNIDSEGDQTCELYMTFYISGTYGGTAIPERLFDYNMCMN